MSGDATPGADRRASSSRCGSRARRADEIAGCAEAMREHVLRDQPDARATSSTPPARAATARTRSTSRPPRRSSRPRPARASRSTATARRRRRRARPTCSRRSGSTSRCRPSGSSSRSTSSASASCSRQAHHPAMKHAAPVRRELAARTVFNVLGPLTNPAGARAQVVGVYAPGDRADDRRGARPARTRGAPTSCTAPRGIDELSPAGPNLVCEVASGRVREYELDPRDARHPALRPGRAARRRPGDERARPSATSSAGADGGHRSGGAAERRRRDRRRRSRRRPPRGPRLAAERSTRAPPRAPRPARRVLRRGGVPRAVSGARHRTELHDPATVENLPAGRTVRCQAPADVDGWAVRFADALAAPGFGAIAEFKRRSPSAGDLRPGGDVAEVARAYERAGARAMSVLVDERFARHLGRPARGAGGDVDCRCSRRASSRTAERPADRRRGRRRRGAAAPARPRRRRPAAAADARGRGARARHARRGARRRGARPRDRARRARDRRQRARPLDVRDRPRPPARAARARAARPDRHRRVRDRDARPGRGGRARRRDRRSSSARR